MPYKTTKRNKQVVIATVMVAGQRRQKTFPGQTKTVWRKAIVWENRKKKELRSTGREKTVREWMDEYLSFAAVKFKGRNTLSAKTAALQKIVAFCGADMMAANITVADCLKHLRQQAVLRTNNAANRDRKELAAAWEFGRKYSGFSPVNPFRFVDKFPEERHPRYVPPMDDFLKVLHRATGQDFVMLMVFLCLAPRRSEVFGIKRSDIDFVNKRIKIWTRKRKGGNLEYDWLPIVDGLLPILKKWLIVRKKTKSKYPHIFLSRSGKPFIERADFMGRICRQARVKKFGFHGIRHLTAVYLYHHGEKTQTIQLILRHLDPRTTSKYLKKIGPEEGRTGLDKITTGLKPVISTGLAQLDEL